MIALCNDVDQRSPHKGRRPRFIPAKGAGFCWAGSSSSPRHRPCVSLCLGRSLCSLLGSARRGGARSDAKREVRAAAPNRQDEVLIAHEVGHVLARHGNERVSQTTLAQGGLVAVAILTGADTPEKQQVLAALGVGARSRLK